MHTDTYETVSDVKSFAMNPAYAAFGASAITPIINSKSSADQPNERMIPAILEKLASKDEFLFAPNIDARLKIHKPFRVRIIGSVESVAAHVEEIEEFGYGGNRGEALDDLGRTIAELYFSLESKRERLSSDLSGVLRCLEEHIMRVHS